MAEIPESGTVCGDTSRSPRNGLLCVGNWYIFDAGDLDLSTM
jgi:hypothetical protein